MYKIAPWGKVGTVALCNRYIDRNFVQVCLSLSVSFHYSDPFLSPALQILVILLSHTTATTSKTIKLA
jgi:hypothetical protein